MSSKKELWACDIPDAKKGSAKIETFEVSEMDSKFSAIRGDYIPAGVYKRLLVNGKLVMSDTRRERREHSEFIRMACGDVLIHGLGLACCIREVAAKSEVTSITVVEINQDVIDIVNVPGVEVICADALTFNPPKGVRYGAVWHDIWPDKCSDNLKEMHKLHRRYGRRSDWQGSWARQEIEYNLRRRGW